MLTLTKSEMINHLMENVSMTRQEGRLFVENFFNQLSDSLAQGYQVKLAGFGNFELKEKSQRPGRNPKTGKSVDVAAKAVPHFKPGKALRDAVNESAK